MRDDKNRAKVGAAMQSALDAQRSDIYTDYNYSVQVRIDSDTGAMTVFCFGAESGEIGKPIHGGRDIDIANSLGRALIEDARREEHGWEPERTLDETWPAC